jgi:predicted DNA-binding transcriptional regulator
MKEKLAKLGLNKTEIEIYLYLIARGRATASLISKDTGIKRPTVYAAAAELARRKIVTEDFGGTSKYFTASARDLENTVLAKKKEIIDEESLVNSVLPDLKKLAQNANTPTPHIQYVREADLTEFLSRQTPIWDSNMLETGETSWWGYNSKGSTASKQARDFVDYYWKNSSKKIDLHLFSPDHQGEQELRKNKYERRFIKYWDEEFNSSLWIMGDYIVLSVTNQKPQYLIQIKDRIMAESLRRTYRRLWNLSN